MSMMIDDLARCCARTNPRLEQRRTLAVFPLAVIVFLLGSVFAAFRPSCAQSNATTIKVDPAAVPHYRLLTAGVSAARLSATIHTLSGYPTRAVGYPGNASAEQYVRAGLESVLGAAQVHTESFHASVPLDNGTSTIVVNGKPYPVAPLWPNLVRTSTLPAGGVSGPMIYAGNGDLTSFSGKDVSGSIVLMDFNCGTNWLNAARLGAKAIVFAEPDRSMRGEAEAKFVGIAVSIPRFWISRRDAAALEATALTTPDTRGTVQCDDPWTVRTADNIIGILPGTDPILGKQVMVVEAYYDSMSVVPSLAPGAESACGIASLLEIARAFKADPPKRSVMFVATDAHFLGLQGTREYVHAHIDDWLPVSGWDKFQSAAFHKPSPTRTQVYLFTALDLSSQSSQVGAFYKGNFYDYREDVQSDSSDLGRYVRENAAKIGLALGFDPTIRFADGINPIGGKTWHNYLPGKFAFDGEVAGLAGGKAITFATCDDARPRVDTPGDTADAVNVANVVQQTQMLVCEYWHLLNDTNDPDAYPSDSVKGVLPIATYPAWTRQGLRLGYSELTGRVLEFDPRKSFVPNQPVSGAMAVVQTASKTYTGVRGNLIEKTGASAAYDFVGIPLMIAQAHGFDDATGEIQHISAYHLSDANDADRGNIDFAPDLGVYGATNYPIDLPIDAVHRTSQVIVFSCVPTSIFDLVDQANFKTLTTVQILDGSSNGQPREYGYSLSKPDAGVTYVEDVAVIFSQPQTRLKVLMNSGVGASHFVLLNSRSSGSRGDAEGIGYNVADPNDPKNPPGFVVDGVVTNTPLRVASDMWALDEFRIKKLAKYRIVDEQMDSLHVLAKKDIDAATAALADHRYDLFDSFARQAWGYESRVYPQAQQTANDVVQGVLFYLFLMIPFSYFLERLLVSAPNIGKQLGWVFGIFVLVFLIFANIHPAFDITANPGIVLIAFVMLALSILVTSLIWGKFEQEMQQFSRATSGVHKIDVGKASIAMAAFALGISNMRRRKARSILTCITLILLTFTVLSFTSVVNSIKVNQVDAPGTPLYNGILLRNATWDALQDPAYRLLNDEYDTQYPVAPRSWFYGTQQGQQTFLTLRRADLSTDVKGVVGFSPSEASVTHPQTTLIAGRWFQPGDVYETILPDAVASSLGITAADVGRATVTFSGQEYVVIGIVDGLRFASVKDLDNEEITPVDFITMASQGSGSGASGANAASQGFQEFRHLDPENTLMVPYQTLINLGGDLRSVGVNFNNKATVQQQLGSLIKRIDLNLYAGIGNRNYRYSSIGATSGKGFLNVLIPIMIAGLIVLNTMLGSVFERVKEIGIFSSVGLSPSSIGTLFLAESLVYAVIGSVSGYLIGQALSKIISTFNLLPGLYLNFSSMSAVVSTLTVVGVVLLSTLYPARKASEVATPSVDRVWRLPEPVGDDWTISLPFAITGNQAQGVNGFLREWFRSFEEQSVGDFLTQDIETSVIQGKFGYGYQLTGRIWLAPFDLGVSQDIELRTLPTDLEDVYEVVMHIHRQSGDVSNWKRVNRRFLNVVRRQFLIWRTISAEEREKYLSETDSLPPAALVPSDLSGNGNGLSPQITSGPASATAEVAPAL